MIVVMEVNATEAQVESVIERMMEMGFRPSRTTGQSQTVIAGVGHGSIDLAGFEAMAGVKEAHRISSPFKLASRVWRPGGTRIPVGSAEIGGGGCTVMARAAASQVATAAAAGAAGVVVAATRARFGYERVAAEALEVVNREASR
jgi:3-deoxy-7-phosphoheptulonate synthase